MILTLELLKRAYKASISLLELARQQGCRYSLKHAYIIWAIVTHARHQFEIFQVLALPACRSLIFRDPRFPFKFAINNYLARDLTTADRASSLLHHYRYLNATLPTGFLIRAFQQGWTIYEEQRSGVLYRITMGLANSKEHREGELALELRVDGVRIYVLQFTVIPGRIVGAQARNAVLISRIQGVRGCYPLIQSTTKAFEDVAPPALLVSALQGVARVLGIGEWAGITAAKQTCFGWDRPDMFNTAYDDFFTQQGGVLTTANFFLGSFAEQKPLGPVNNGHKARKKKRRAIRLLLANQVAEFIFWRCAEYAALPVREVQESLAAQESDIHSLI